MTNTQGSRALSAVVRFYIYGIQGFCYEVIFTALFDFYMHGNWQLKGHSSLSSFLIYGSCSFCVEHLYMFLWYKHRISRLVRMPLYLCIAYSWEFMTGWILRYFNACPWDYSHYNYNFKGLITLEYAPGWLLLAWYQDVVADYLLRVRVSSSWDEHPHSSKYSSTSSSSSSSEKSIKQR